MSRHRRGDTCDIATLILAHDESPNRDDRVQDPSNKRAILPDGTD